jgi:hypothetical protein
MSRAERPLDPDGDPLQAFAAQLRTLRDEGGRPTYAALARRTHRSPSTLSEAAGGRKFPSLATTLSYVRALGGDESTWTARWRETARQLGADNALGRDREAWEPENGTVRNGVGEPAIAATDGEPDAAVSDEATAETAEPDNEPPARPAGWGTFRMPRRITIPAAAVVLASLVAMTGWRIGTEGEAANREGAGTGAPVSSGPAVASGQPAMVRDGADPKDAGCAADPAVATLDTQAAVVENRMVGAVELRYSPMCGVSWPRFLPTPVPATLPPSRVFLTVVDGANPRRSASFDMEYTGISVYGNVLNSTRSCVWAEVHFVGTGWRSPVARTDCYRGGSQVGAHPSPSR